MFRGEPLSGLAGNYLAGQRQRLIARRDVALRDRLDLDGEGRAESADPEPDIGFYA